jgi:hypothetical protein
MSDLSEVLPDFDLKPYRHLTHSLEKNGITVCDLITFDAIEIAKRCPLPLGDLKAMIRAVITALHQDIGLTSKQQSTSSEILAPSTKGSGQDVRLARSVWRPSLMVKTLDSTIDTCLGGGFHTGHITEIVGER